MTGWRPASAAILGKGEALYSDPDGGSVRIQPEIDEVAVVVRGDFNPAIFTPAWFALHGLLPESAADSAKLEIAHPQVTEFSTDWLHLHVTTDRFSADTAQAPHVRVRDIVARVFGELLDHTPLRVIGINRNVHFRTGSSAERDRIGRTLAPVAPWGRCGQKLGLDGEHGGMTSLRMSQLRPEGRPPGGQINVTVEPSNRIGHGSGVYVGVNDHYRIDRDDARGRARLMGFLYDNFDTSLRRSDDIIDHIMSLAKEG